GARSFEPALEFPFPSLPALLVSFDWNGDGGPDLAFFSRKICPNNCASENGLCFLLNETVPASSGDSNRNGVPDECEGTLFHRGDPNQDGKHSVTDPVFLLRFLFQGGPAPPCAESADAQNDGKLDLADAIWLLKYIFLSGPPPAPPGPVSAPCG